MSPTVSTRYFGLVRTRFGRVNNTPGCTQLSSRPDTFKALLDEVYAVAGAEEKEVKRSAKDKR
jgi:hypothetical protein